MVTVLTFGEALGVAATDPGEPLVTAGRLRLSTAGAEATVAVGLSRLGHRAVWAGVVGDDQIGRRVMRDLQAENVTTDFVRVSDSAPTAFMLRDHRTPDYVAVTYYRSGSAGSQLSPSDVEKAFDVADIDVVHLTGITPLLSETASAATRRAVELAAQRGITVSLDVNYRRALGDVDTAGARVREILPAVHTLFVGDDELPLVTGETEPEAAVRALAAMGPSEVVLKLGDRGACALGEDGTIVSARALRVTVADVIGAGDSFVAGYLSARAEKRSITASLERATVCAACTVGTRGDWEGLPTRQDLPVRTDLGRTIR